MLPISGGRAVVQAVSRFCAIHNSPVNADGEGRGLARSVIPIHEPVETQSRKTTPPAETFAAECSQQKSSTASSMQAMMCLSNVCKICLLYLRRGLALEEFQLGAIIWSSQVQLAWSATRAPTAMPDALRQPMCDASRSDARQHRSLRFRQHPDCRPGREA